MRTNDRFASRPAGEKFIHFGRRSIENGDSKAVICHIENEVLAHYGESNQTNVCICQYFLQ